MTSSAVAVEDHTSTPIEEEDGWDLDPAESAPEVKTAGDSRRTDSAAAPREATVARHDGQVPDNGTSGEETRSPTQKHSERTRKAEANAQPGQGVETLRDEAVSQGKHNQ